MSFRARLTLIAALAIAVTVTGASLALWLVAKHELQSSVDAALFTRAQELVDGRTFTPFQRTNLWEEINPDGTPNGSGNYEFRIGRQMLAVARGEGRPYYLSTHIGGQHFRVLVAPLSSRLAPSSVAGAAIVAQNIASNDRALHRIGFWIVLIGGTGVILATLLAAFVAAAALRPIRRLSAAARSVATTGNLTERVEVTSHDEIGDLATRFNEMLAALEQSVGAQRRLVADASHELRTPLTAIRTNLDLIREGHLPEHEVQAALSESATELDELTRLVSDLVELARGEERQLRLEDVQLDDLVAAAVERAQARAPQVQFVSQLSPTLVSADPRLLERAVSNLLDNAVKWSPAGGTIEVSVNGGEVVVRDHGPGISAADLPHVFDRFYRAPAARAKPGSGLGLAIVREAADAHGGAVVAESTGGGARFRLTLPVAA